MKKTNEEEEKEEKKEEKNEEIIPEVIKKTRMIISFKYYIATSKETYYLSDLPCSPMYEKSYTHPAHIQFTIMTPITNFLFTGSINGTVKIWKKFPTVIHFSLSFIQGIEFVKRYDAHKGNLTALTSSFDGLYVASVGVDESIKIYDVNTFDLIRIIKLDYIPGTATWVYNQPMTT